MEDSRSKELGTLVVVVGKARNLPNKSRFGKQAPFCTVIVNGEKQRTKAIKRGGQHPEWDEELRYIIMEDVDDVLVRSDSAHDTSLSSSTSQSVVPPKEDQPGYVTPAALASKSRKGPLDKKGGKSLKLAVYADDPKEPELIGEVVVSIDEVLKAGEEDEWYELQYKEKYSGELYLELTFYSNNAPPVRRNVPRPAVMGGGGFDPSPSTSSASLARQRLSSGLSTSGSVSGMSLYIPPYVQPSRAPSPTPQPVPSSSFSELGLPPGHRRKQSLPVPMHGQPSYPVPLSLQAGIHSAYPPQTSASLNQQSAFHALTRPVSSMSISSSLSNQHIPEAQLPVPNGGGHGYGHRHSVGTPNDAPWGSLLPQSQPSQQPAPFLRPMSTSDAPPWQQMQRIEEERRRQAATPIPRPASSQDYAQPYSGRTSYPADSRGTPSPLPPTSQSNGQQQEYHPHRPHVSSFSHLTAPSPIAGHPFPSPGLTPPPPSSSAPPAPVNHYQIPSSSYGHLPPPDHRSSSPMPGYQQPQDTGRTYDTSSSYGVSTPNHYQPHTPFHHDSYPPRQPSPQPPMQQAQSHRTSYPPPSQAYSPAVQQPGYPQYPPPQLASPPRHSDPAAVPAPNSSGYVPWYQQTQPSAPLPEPVYHAPYGQDQQSNGHGGYSSPPPPVPTRRPIPHPPAPPKQSIGYYPSDELYVQQQQPPAPDTHQAWQQSLPPPSLQQQHQTYSSANPPQTSTPFSPSHSHSNSLSQPTPPPRGTTSWQANTSQYSRTPSPLPPTQAGPSSYYTPPPPSNAYVPPRSVSPQPPSMNGYTSPRPEAPLPAQPKQDWRSYMQNLSLGQERTPSPQPPPAQLQQQQQQQGDWYTPPPSLPSSIRPPEGWRSTLQEQSTPDGHQWRG